MTRTPAAVAPSKDVVSEDAVSEAVVSEELGGAAVVEAVPVGHRGSLSPSRASDFMTCPLLYRFRVVDRLPEAPSPAAVRGTVVHQVLEDLFGLPADQRTLERAVGMLPAAWDTLLEQEPDAIEMFDSPADAATWVGEAAPLLEKYFALEDPTAFEPTEREMAVSTTLEDGLVLRGFIDRLDTNAAGQTRVVDYKTGRAPTPGFESKALFQMRFYALVLWRSTGVLPRLLQLLYLGNGEILRYEPDEADLRATERKVSALWTAITRAYETGDWRPSPSRLCDWCDHKALCPAFGGTPPPLPEVSLDAVVATASAEVGPEALA
ncbi:MAG TPA: PD-(D/E)XK nuclease family protein [Candidatus Nanopelagicales bacterium]|jgi:putative RecB family exonuclease